jgi:hypothetical protein
MIQLQSDVIAPVPHISLLATTVDTGCNCFIKTVWDWTDSPAHIPNPAVCPHSVVVVCSVPFDYADVT